MYRGFHDLSPLGEPKQETSAVNHKRPLTIHLLNLNYAKNDDSQPTFSVSFSRLAKTLWLRQKHTFLAKNSLKIVVKQNFHTNKLYISPKCVS